MPKLIKFSPEFKEQCVRLVAAEMGPEESRNGVRHDFAGLGGIFPVECFTDFTRRTISV